MLETPTKIKITLNNKEPDKIIARLLYRVSSQLVTGMVNMSPIGRANKTVPSWASFKWSWCFMVGMRDAHEEYPKPEMKKKIAQPIRNCLGDRM